MHQYTMVIQWSDEDQLFLVTIPEFSGLAEASATQRVIMPCTHGQTRQEAIKNGEDVIEMYLEAWQAEGKTIPKPSKLQTV